MSDDVTARPLTVGDWPYILSGLRVLVERGAVQAARDVLLAMGISPESQQYRDVIEEALAVKFGLTGQP